MQTSRSVRQPSTPLPFAMNVGKKKENGTLRTIVFSEKEKKMSTQKIYIKSFLKRKGHWLV